MKQFDRTTLKMLRTEIEAALRPIAEKYAISLKTGNGTFGANHFAMKIEGAVVGTDGRSVSEEAENFVRYAEMFGLKVNHLGRVVTLNGKFFTIVGLRPNARKRPVLLEGPNQRNVVASVEYVLRALA